MTLLYTSETFQRHITGAHPEHPRRLVAIEKMLDETGFRGRCIQPDWSPATPQQLERVHDPTYVKGIGRYAAAGGGRIEVDTVVSERSSEVARLAAGAV